jgi:phosphoenolpyruvate carboxykinase (ATP)
MKIESDDRSRSLEELGLGNLGSIHWNLHSPALYEEAIRPCEGTLSHLGPLVVRTGHYTGRLPKDKFFAREPSSEKKIWSGKINRRDRSKELVRDFVLFPTAFVFVGFYVQDVPGTVR